MMRFLLTGSVVALLLVPVAASAQSRAIQITVGSSSIVTLPPGMDPTAVQVLYRGVPVSSVSAKLGQGLDRTLEVTADRLARTGTGYTIRLTTPTSRVPTDIPLEILASGGTSPELAFLPAPASTTILAAPTFTPLRLTTAALKFTGQRFGEPKALTTAALRFTGQRHEPKSITTPALRFTGTRP